MSNTERTKLKKREEELRAQRHGSRKDRKVTLDFAGRRVVEDNDSAGRNMYDVNDDVIQEIYFGAKPKVNSSQQENLADLVNPSICVPSPKVCVDLVSPNIYELIPRICVHLVNPNICVLIPRLGVDLINPNICVLIPH